jgi:amino acid adenylation domain-containing protein
MQEQHEHQVNSEGAAYNPSLGINLTTPWLEAPTIQDPSRAFNETKSEYPSHKCITELFLDQVFSHPEQTAVLFGKQALSYRELAETACAVAAFLRGQGVSADDCVGLFVEPSIELMAGAWGILFAGGAYLPLSPEYPEDRIKYMIEDSRSKVIFTQEKLKARLAQFAPQGTAIVTLEDAQACAKNEIDLGVGPRPNDLAYIIYTSGSTGKPKGVMIEHRSIVNQMHWLKSVYGLDQTKTIVQKTPMSFDAAQWEILAPACGAKVVMGTLGVYRDPEKLIEIIREYGVTTLQCVPTLLQALADSDAFASCGTLTQIFSGGEALTSRLSAQVLELMPACSLTNLYGPTECTINSSAFTVDPATLKDGPAVVSIGGPVHNTQYHILDEHRRPVAVGEIGELYIGGDALARGYLYRPELTAEKFVVNPFTAEYASAKLYKTGDLVFWTAEGTVQFVGRADNQVKLRGYRIELDEIKVAIQKHGWVKNAAVVIKDDVRTGFQNLLAFVELDPKEASLMDQGNHGAHHQSKASKVQVKMQLANKGCREDAELAGLPCVELPGVEATQEQRRRVFARKTYRFFEGGALAKSDVVALLSGKPAAPAAPGAPSLTVLGEVLRYFGQFKSPERLLPKYGYASPGALYATQLYLELDAVAGLESGFYYYHPVHHRLVLMRRKDSLAQARIKLHFIGKKSAIEPVYKDNIQEVLEIETGHMLGLFDEILPAYGLAATDSEPTPTAKDLLGCAPEDYYLGAFELAAGETPEPPVEIYVQAHPGKIKGLPAGQYRWKDAALEKISDELILKKQVIAINQAIYERASLGITVVSRNPKESLRYVDLGRALQRFQMNELGLGFMSSGYSSKTGNPLPSAKRIDGILASLGLESGPSYFFLGGRISDEQVISEGMKEDSVHMKGPAEMIKDDLVHFLPDYMLPNKVLVLDKLPLTANGKVDSKALAQVEVDLGARAFVAPRTETEKRLEAIWKKAMKLEAVSVQDDFFELGGNSLVAVAIVNRVNKEFGRALPLQVIFEAPTIERLAAKMGAAGAAVSSRLVPLQPKGDAAPVYCWPGLGGYTMNLRLLAGKTGTERPFFGVQAQGINEGEVPYATIREMAAADIALIKKAQPAGPYTLWGYSFGARVAFEAAYQLEQAGEKVERLVLIAPGSPKVRQADAAAHGREPSYSNKAFVTILYSVFTGSISGPNLERCLEVSRDDESFAAYLCTICKNLEAGLVGRIIRIVKQTYEFEYTFRELAERRLCAPITILKARGDDYSFIENSGGYSASAPVVRELAADHYSLLKAAGIDELTAAIQAKA